MTLHASDVSLWQAHGQAAARRREWNQSADCGTISISSQAHVQVIAVSAQQEDARMLTGFDYLDDELLLALDDEELFTNPTSTCKQRSRSLRGKIKH